MEESKTAELLTIIEAAERIRVSRQTIYAWIKEGRVKPVKTPGGRLRIPEDQLVIKELVATEQAVSNSLPIRDISDLDPDTIEQLGTKEKYWFWRTGNHWYWNCEGDRFLFKAGREGTGENWAEKVASELCELLGLPHAEYDLATYKNRKGVITPSFVPEGALLVLGNEILARYVPEYEKTKRYRHGQHTLRVVLAVVNSQTIDLPIGWSELGGVDSAGDVFVGYLMLDAWIANQDRHHENWGFIVVPEEGRIHLAPTFDHASSLGRNENDASRESRMTTRDSGRGMEKYVERARSAFYANESEKKPLPTVVVFQETAMRKRDAARQWLNKLEAITPSDTREILDRVPKEDISNVAIEFTQRMLELNRQRLLAIEV